PDPETKKPQPEAKEPEPEAKEPGTEPKKPEPEATTANPVVEKPPTAPEPIANNVTKLGMMPQIATNASNNDDNNTTDKPEKPVVTSEEAKPVMLKEQPVVINEEPTVKLPESNGKTSDTGDSVNGQQQSKAAEKAISSSLNGGTDNGGEHPEVNAGASVETKKVDLPVAAAVAAAATD
ncbi:hypothetical protein BOX15_Mlig008738g1, partial [Macrostomum lignano]